MKTLSKLTLKTVMLFAGVLIFSACNNSNTSMERRIADLENRVAQLEEKTNAMASNNPVAPTNNQPNVARNNQASTSNNTPENTSGTPAFEFKSESHNFGRVPEGDVVRHTFEFTNSGDAPLVINNASATCGCTVPSWPREPIAPGESGEILVEFDSKNKSGIQNKTVTLKANTNPATKRLSLRSEVVSGEGTAGPVRGN